MCGNCCTGPEGYVLFTPEEAGQIAAGLGLCREAFEARYTHQTVEGPSLNEVRTEFGFDCVFLDRTTIPGKAVCGIYANRPSQCRTWPFWKQNLRTPGHWRSAGRTCPGLNKGPLHSPEHIRLTVEGHPGAARS
jgi:Fe-S-cluster containining protein